MSYRILVIQLPQFQPKFNEITASAPLLLTWQPRAATCSKGCSLEVSDKKSWETYQIITVGIEFTVALFNSFYIYIYIFRNYVMTFIYFRPLHLSAEKHIHLQHEGPTHAAPGPTPNT